MAPPQWAYQVENFVNEPDEELVCSICRAVFCDPVMCPCDHVFCRVCIGQWIENSRNCPICRKRVSHSSVKQSVPIVKNLILKLQVHCHNRSRGCKAQFSIESSESHLKECEYEFIKCKNKPCKDKLFRKDISKHETSECPHRYVKCKTCGSKIRTVGKPEKHNCLRALLERLRAKNAVIRKRNEQIENLKTEIKVMKAVTSGSRFPGLEDQNFWHSSLTPEEITINFTDMNSTSGSSDSDDFSDNSVVIFTSNYAESDDDDLEADSFSTNNQDSLEYSQNDIPQNASEFRNAESQTVDLPLNSQQDELQPSPSSSAACGNASIAVDVPESSFGETEDRPRRQMKRRTTVQKPAKRWLPSSTQLSSTDSESDHASSVTSKQRKFAKKSAENKAVSKHNGASASTTHPEAGPSSGSTSAEHSGGAAADSSAGAKKDLLGKTKLAQRLARQGIPDTNSRSSTPLPGSAVFERTLALLEHYNIESDPEWLPEYASHRGNDTTTDSDSSSYNLVDSSCSELSNSESANPDASERTPSSMNDIMQWTFESSSEDDPDWQPPESGSED